MSFNENVLNRMGEEQLFGSDLAERPEATAVKKGTTFVLIGDPLVVYMSNGTDWVVL